MDYIVSMLQGASPEETVIRFFVFVLFLTGILDLIKALVGGVKS